MQAQLRHAFRRWGRPGQVRVDNGCPWGATGGLPTALALWLFGVYVAVAWNQAGCPQQNGVVERTQGVSKGWVEPHTCASAAELQRRLGQMDDIQRSRYPSIAGQSRLAAYPALSHSGRAYSVAWEQRRWSLKETLRQLAEYVVVRRVDRSGKVSLYDRGQSVGKRWVGQYLYASLEAEARAWVLATADGREVRRCPATELTRENIVGLRVSRPRGSAGTAQ